MPLQEEKKKKGFSLLFFPLFFKLFFFFFLSSFFLSSKNIQIMLDVQKEHVWPMNNPSLSIPPELLQSLRQHSLFQRTNNESFLEKIACCMHLRTYAPRDVIIVEGEPSKAMFFLLRGSVDVCSADFERIYATLPKGSCFGEIGILYSMARTATVIASTKCIVAVLTADEVKTLLPQYPEVERMLRFEAEERLALLKKSNTMQQQQEKKVNQMPVVERNIEEFSGARHILQRVIKKKRSHSKSDLLLNFNFRFPISRVAPKSFCI
jgi:F-box/leucine-rich repeat protein 7